MKQTDTRRFRNDVYRLYSRISKLNLYVQNVKSPDASRLAAELKDISVQLDRTGNLLFGQDKK
ncbi:MAG: hypothetical protein WCS27_16655 [Victivallaceae bacterium]